MHNCQLTTFVKQICSLFFKQNSILIFRYPSLFMRFKTDLSFLALLCHYLLFFYYTCILYCLLISSDWVFMLQPKFLQFIFNICWSCFWNDTLSCYHFGGQASNLQLKEVEFYDMKTTMWPVYITQTKLHLKEYYWCTKYQRSLLAVLRYYRIQIIQFWQFYSNTKYR